MNLTPCREDFFNHVTNNDLSIVKKVIEENPEYLLIRTGNEWAYTCIHWTSQLGFFEQTKFLLESLKQYFPEELEYIINSTSSTNIWSPTALAARYGFADILKLLIEYGGRVDKSISVGNYCIHSAAFYGHTDCVKVILDKFPDQLNVQNPKNKFTAIMMTCQEGMIETFKYLFYEKHANILTRIDDGGSTIYWCYQNEHHAITEIVLKELYRLVEEGKKEEEEDAKSATMLLHDLFFKVVQENDIDMFKKLIEKDPTLIRAIQQNEWCYTALHWSSQLGYEQLTEMILNLLEKNYPNDLRECLNIVSEKGSWTPLTLACRYDSMPCLKLLMKYKDLLNGDIPSEGGNLACHLASINGNTEMVRLLMQTFPHHLNVVTEKGFTCFNAAVSNGKFETAECLAKEFHCDINIKNNEGWGPLEYAESYEYTEILDLLDKLGINKD
ncbi:hypothetical protein ABK040_002440 [Willaertia magna]